MTHYQADDSPLGLKARGLLGLLLDAAGTEGAVSMSVHDIRALVPDGHDAIRNALNQLESAGYMRTEHRRQGGRLAKAVRHLRANNAPAENLDKPVDTSTT